MLDREDKNVTNIVARALYATAWGGSGDLPFADLTERERIYWSGRAAALIASLDQLGYELRFIPPEP